MEVIRIYGSPLGRILLTGEDGALTGLRFEGQRHSPPAGACPPGDLPVFGETARWLDIYFRGGIPDFTPALKLKGTPFQRRVWEILRTIPYGETVTYGEIARRIAGERGTEKMSARAVGGAAGRNPVALIVPCHRVVGADGSMTGYAGGTERKIRLLQMERETLGRR